MNLIKRTYAWITWLIIRNRSGYTDTEIKTLRKTIWLTKLTGMKKSFYWFKVEMFKTNRCSAGWKQGDTLFFDFSGMLITRKCPKAVCPHAIAALSPVMYSCLDRSGRGANPAHMLVQYVSCTDPGFHQKGMGNNLMKVTYERMPIFEYLRNMLDLAPRLFFRSWVTRGLNPPGGDGMIAGINIPLKTSSGTEPNRMSQYPCDAKALSRAAEFIQAYPIPEAERKSFLASERRVARLLGIERYKDARIVVEIEDSQACLAGHQKRDKIEFDAKGCLMVTGEAKPICARLINKIWYRLIMVLDRMADDSQDFIGDGQFTGELPEVRMTCYGADFPQGDCGQVVMSVSVKQPSLRVPFSEG